jgi:hypothetical protein
MVTPRAAFTVDAFYSPLWVQRNAAAARTNDGLFSVGALLTYTFRYRFSRPAVPPTDPMGS